MLAAVGENIVQANIDLTGCADMPNLETLGAKPILHEPGFLHADPVLHPVRDDESGRWRPDVPGVRVSEIAALMHMTACDKPDVGLSEQCRQSRTHGLRNKADRSSRLFGIFRRIQK